LLAQKEGDLINKIINQNLKFPNSIHISKSAQNLIVGLLEKNQNYRIEMNDQLFDDWYGDT
jgi:hypothetical protein